MKTQPKKDFTGEKYYHLTAISCTGRKLSRSFIWRWRCDCGNEIEARPCSVKCGDNQSCGCENKKVRAGKRLPSGVSSFRAALSTYKRSAKSRGYAFELDEDDFRYITSQNCHYCGKPPSNVFTLRWTNGDYIYNGLDRLDSSVGYYIDNVVPCCYECNYSKRDREYYKFIDWIHKVSMRFSAVGYSS